MYARQTTIAYRNPQTDTVGAALFAVQDLHVLKEKNVFRSCLSAIAAMGDIVARAHTVFQEVVDHMPPMQQPRRRADA